jgi:hypothetical protein
MAAVAQRAIKGVAAPAHVLYTFQKSVEIISSVPRSVAWFFRSHMCFLLIRSPKQRPLVYCYCTGDNKVAKFQIVRQPPDPDGIDCSLIPTRKVPEVPLQVR